MVVCLSSFWVLVAAPLVACYAVDKRSFVIKDSVGHHINQWDRISVAPSDYPLNFRIGLKQNRIDELLNKLRDISDPDHQHYGNYLTSSEIHDLAGPNPESLDLVLEWLNEHGIDQSLINLSPSRDSVSMTIPVQTAQQLLNTEYNVWSHKLGGAPVVRTASYYLPQYLHDHIELVHPTTYFANPKLKPSIDMLSSSHKDEYGYTNDNDNDRNTLLSKKSIITFSSEDNGNEDSVRVDQLRKFYKTYDYVPKAADKNKFAILGYLNEVTLNSDLQLYLKDQRPDAVGATFNEISVKGGITGVEKYNETQLNETTGKEAALDVQTAFGVTYPTPIEFISVGGSPPFKADLLTPENTNEPYLDFIDYMMGLPDNELPQTVSTSYGDSEQTVPKDYAKRVCNGLAQLGARGVTLLYSSGDTGVGPDGANAYQCQTNDGKNTSTFLPSFPASCPYVTTVGATQNFEPEIAQTESNYTDYYSGGGFSYYFERPDYQDDAVNNYLKKVGDNFKGLYNPNGRAYPDVSAQGLYFRIFWNGTANRISGTSASSPLFASVVTLLNDNLISQNKKPLGFMNPFLYKKGYKGLNDIVQGSARGCNTTGFEAEEGWDAVTGLGTPNFEKLVDLIN